MAKIVWCLLSLHALYAAPNCALIFKQPDLDEEELQRLANIGIDLTFDFPAREEENATGDLCALFFKGFKRNFHVWRKLDTIRPIERITLD